MLHSLVHNGANKSSLMLRFFLRICCFTCTGNHEPGDYKSPPREQNIESCATHGPKGSFSDCAARQTISTLDSSQPSTPPMPPKRKAQDNMGRSKRKNAKTTAGSSSRKTAAALDADADTEGCELAISFTQKPDTRREASLQSPL